mmetsp:Transcript_66700/g.134447  ORF Transcript_66700/g.134447 Transcript_66700/m.134447 type:complete len:278 (+) Transcript_66700:361-1194(+)
MATALLDSGQCLAAMARSCSKRFVFSGSSPATILAGLASTIVFKLNPTTLLIFSRKATFASLEALESSLASFSLSSNRPSPKPVALHTALNTSCRKRKGGFSSSLAVILGLLMSSPTSLMVSSTPPVHCSTNASKEGVDSGPITSRPSDRGADSSLAAAPPVRCPPPRLGGGLACAAAGPGASESFASGGCSFADAPSSFAPPPLSPRANAGSGCCPARVRSTTAELAAGLHSRAAFARSTKKRFVRSGSTPATTLPDLISHGRPCQLPTNKITRSR